MTFEFLIAYRCVEGTDIEKVLRDLLTGVLEDNLNEFEPDAVKQMIRIRCDRRGATMPSEDHNASQYRLLGFALDLPDGTAQLQTVVADFAAALPETAPIFHTVKFEDPILRADLAQLAEEIFALEMKLRRALSLVYLHANQGLDPFNLLSGETVQPGPNKPTVDQMKKAAENQFFHLGFSQYINLNKRANLQFADILELIRSNATYDQLRAEINRDPVEHEDDTVLLAGLKERMNAIEAMRNCVAHNRCPTRAVKENYENVRPLLHELLDDYLARWEPKDDVPAAEAVSPPAGPIDVEAQHREPEVAAHAQPAEGQPAEAEASPETPGAAASTNK